MVSLGCIEYVTIIVQHKDITFPCRLQELTKCSSSGFQRLLWHISTISYLLMNYSWAPVYTLSPEVYRLHHPAIKSNHTLLYKHGEIIHTADKHTNMYSRIIIPPQFYPVKPQYSAVMYYVNVCVCACGLDLHMSIWWQRAAHTLS